MLLYIFAKWLQKQHEYNVFITLTYQDFSSPCVGRLRILSVTISNHPLSKQLGWKPLLNENKFWNISNQKQIGVHHNLNSPYRVKMCWKCVGTVLIFIMFSWKGSNFLLHSLKYSIYHRNQLCKRWLWNPFITFILLGECFTLHTLRGETKACRVYRIPEDGYIQSTPWWPTSKAKRSSRNT